MTDTAASLQKEKAFVHLSVLAEAAPQALLTDPDGIYVDATFGRGGHSRRILAALSPKGRLIAFDRDPEAVRAAASITDSRLRSFRRRFQGCRLSSVRGMLPR